MCGLHCVPVSQRWDVGLVVGVVRPPAAAAPVVVVFQSQVVQTRLRSPPRLGIIRQDSVSPVKTGKSAKECSHIFLQEKVALLY